MGTGTRRKFLGTAAAAAISGTTVGCGGSGRGFRFFSEQEARTMDALLDWIIPGGDGPGARDAGVIHYIDRQLTGHFREHRKTYRDGLATVDRLGGFTHAPLDSATRVFFDLVVTHAMQGFYADPRHGGNRDFVSWRMLGLAPVQVRGRDRRESRAGGGNAKG